MDRLLNEPALVVTVVLAVMNALGVDPGDQRLVANVVESVILLVAGVVIRSQVSPTRKTDG